jgi:hypothetical protein
VGSCRTARLGPPRIAKIFFPVNVFIKCRNCGQQNCMNDIPVRRADLAVFRGSEDSVKCRNCQAEMDTVTAYCGEQVGSEIDRRDDPKL